MGVSRLIGYILAIAALFSFMTTCKKSDNADTLSGEVLFPKGGEVFVVGYNYPISWEDNYSTEVRIKLYKSNNYYCEITRSTINNGGFSWVVPHNLENGIDYKIKIFSNNSDFLFYESKKEFTIIDSCETSTFTDPRDNRIYNTIKIGNQWWFAENLKFEATGSYNCLNNPSFLETYGKLYTWQAAINSAPSGWHLPSDDEWKEFESYLGVPSDELNTIAYRGGNLNIFFKEGGLAFNLRYAGYFKPEWNSNYSFNSAAYFWSSTTGESGYWYRALSINAIGIYRGKLGRSNAMSVRYIKD